MSTAISKDKRPSALSTPTELRLPWDESIEREFGVDKTKWRALTETKFAAAQSSATVVLALAYCKARNIDPMKGLIHIVPVWNKHLGKNVDTIWPGIGEIRTTAFRTGQYAGRSETVYGRDITQNLGGVEMTYPEWAQVTVRRLVAGVPVEFSGPRAYWIETYATAKHDTDAPNEMWRNRPRGQIEKCAEAAALRAAFPEEVGSDYCADEIRTYERGGVVIDAPQAQKPKTLGDLVKPAAIEQKQPSEHALHVYSKCMTALERATKQEHLDWVDKHATEDVTNEWDEDQFTAFSDRRQKVAKAIEEPQTADASFPALLRRIAPMSALEANAEIARNGSGEFTEDEMRQLDNVMRDKEAKEGKL